MHFSVSVVPSCALSLGWLCRVFLKFSTQWYSFSSRVFHREKAI